MGGINHQKTEMLPGVVYYGFTRTIACCIPSNNPIPAPASWTYIRWKKTGSHPRKNHEKPLGTFSNEFVAVSVDAPNSHIILQGGAPKIAKLVYNSNN